MIECNCRDPSVRPKSFGLSVSRLDLVYGGMYLGRSQVHYICAIVCTISVYYVPFASYFTLVMVCYRPVLP